MPDIIRQRINTDCLLGRLLVFLSLAATAYQLAVQPSQPATQQPALAFPAPALTPGVGTDSVICFKRTVIFFSCFIDPTSFHK